jgi:nitroreductase
MLQHSGPLSRQHPIRAYEGNQITEVEQHRSIKGLAPWNISESHFPFYGNAAEKLAFCVRYAILAPSSHNTQPWHFVIQKNQIELYADRTRRLPVIDPDDRELIISCGAALANLCIAIRHFGYESDVTLGAQPNDANLIATIGLGRERKPTCQEQILFQTIPRRRTNRSAYENTPISRSLLGELRFACSDQGISLTDFSGREQKLKIARLIGDGDRRQMSDPAFRTELAYWTRSAKVESRDGIPCYAQHLPRVLDFAAPFMARLIRTFDMGDFTAARDADLANASAVLAVLSTPVDSPADWLAAGIALEHVLLTARASGVWTSFLNQPIEVPELRSALRDLTGCPGTPQVLVRMGYGQESEPAPRCALDEVLTQ